MAMKDLLQTLWMAEYSDTRRRYRARSQRKVDRDSVKEQQKTNMAKTRTNISTDFFFLCDWCEKRPEKVLKCSRCKQA